VRLIDGNPSRGDVGKSMALLRAWKRCWARRGAVWYGRDSRGIEKKCSFGHVSKNASVGRVRADEEWIKTRTSFIVAVAFDVHGRLQMPSSASCSPR